MIAMATTDRHDTRMRRANDAVLTEMARSLLRGDRPAEDASAGRSTAARTERVRHAAQRFRRPAAGRRGAPAADSVGAATFS